MDESEMPFLKVSRSKCQSVSLAFHLRTAHTCDMHHNPYKNLVIGPAVFGLKINSYLCAKTLIVY